MNLLRPSQLHLINACRASYYECLDLSSAGNEHTSLGTFTHHVIHKLLKGGEFDFTSEVIKHNVDEEQAKIRYAMASNYTKTINLQGRVYLEQIVRMDLSRRLPEFVGQIDLMIDPGGTELFIHDYKTGWSDYKPPVRNPQIWAYAVMARHYIELDPSRKIHHVSAQIDYPVLKKKSRSQRFSAQQLDSLKEYIAEMVNEATGQAEAENLQYNVGDHCRFCPARLKCDVYNAELSNRLTATKDVNNLPQIACDLDSEELGHLIFLANAGKTLDADLLRENGVLRNLVDNHGNFKLQDGSEWGAVESEKEVVQRSEESVKVLGLEAFAKDQISLRDAVEHIAKQRRKENGGRLKRGERKAIQAMIMDAGIVETEPTWRYQIINDPRKVDL